MTAVTANEAMADLESACERLGKPFPSAAAMVRQLTEGIDWLKAATIVKQLLEGRRGQMSVDVAVKGLEEELASIDAELEEVDERRAELRDKRKQVQAGVKALAKIMARANGGGSGRTNDPVEQVPCPQCGRHFGKGVAISTHIRRAHPERKSA